MAINDKKRSGRKASSESASPASVTGIQALVERFEQNANDNRTKISVTDYIRLVQMLREQQAEEPADIEVTWVDPQEDPCLSEV